MFLCAPARASQSVFGVNVGVYNCNNNSVCDLDQNENSANCVADCPVIATSTPTTTDNNSSGGGGGGGGSINSPIIEVTSSPIILPPNPVINPIFVASSSDRVILLRWTKPALAQWKKIIIRRSTLFYPENITAGGLLYDGLGQTTDQINFFLEDKNLTNGKRYYYTIFVLDSKGVYSSGSSLSAIPISAKIISPPLEVVKIEIPPEKSLPLSAVPQIKTKFSDIIFLNNQDKIRNQEDKVNFKSGDQVSLQIPMEKIPANTQTGLITLGTQTGYQTYILQKNNNFFGTSLPAINDGEYQSSVTFLDNNHQVLGKIDGKINFIATESAVRYSIVQNVKNILNIAKVAMLNSVISWKRVVGVSALFLLLFLTKL
ncbi:MAG: hypothetical protein NT034_03255 [Candidatus Magasanikbacteria bacterium]|nr:hypothetical protein [Candidatus Magasanikbacteria bacterium]